MINTNYSIPAFKGALYFTRDEFLIDASSIRTMQGTPDNEINISYKNIPNVSPELKYNELSNYKYFSIDPNLKTLKNYKFENVIEAYKKAITSDEVVEIAREY